MRKSIILKILNFQLFEVSDSAYSRLDQCLQNSCKASVICKRYLLTLKAPFTTAADDNFFLYFFFREKQVLTFHVNRLLNRRFT